MIILKAAAVVAVNFILYLSFGSFFVIRKGKEWSATEAAAVGFMAYYGIFALFTLPVMFTYRPLSLLARIWLIPCVVVVVLSAVIFRKQWGDKIRKISAGWRCEKLFFVVVTFITVLFVTLAVTSYNFTLDAAYYVANVTTNVDTDMINVYDAFTGNWLDHFELRYVFATYYVNDAIVCSLVKIPALVQTKTVMSATVMMIVSLLYAMISRRFFKEHTRALLMYALMMITNLLFISMYTTSNFLMTRTYEGKTVVGNIALILLFSLYMSLVDEGGDNNIVLKLFIVCLGTATVSSTANMVIPAAVMILFVPYAIYKKRFSLIPKVICCTIPQIVMMLAYVLYVKGYYAIYTFPR